MRPSSALAALAAAAALIGGGTLIAGCGSSAGLDPVARAAEVSEKQAGVRFTFEIQVSSPQSPSGFTITGGGYQSRSQKAARMSMNFPGMPGLSATGTSIEGVELYPFVYLHMPFIADKLPAGKSWIELDTSKLAKALSAGSPSQPLSFGETDPTQFLQYLRASGGDVHKVGSQQLYGVPTTRYQSTLQLKRVLEGLPSFRRAIAKAMLQQGAFDGAIPVEVWIDAQKLVRRVQMSLSFSRATASGTVTITVNFPTYGPVPVISAPAPGEVVDLTSRFASRFGGLGGG
jgi:hypothetical protein